MNSQKTVRPFIRVITVLAICLAIFGLIALLYMPVKDYYYSQQSPTAGRYIGRLTIPSVGIDVGCYEFDERQYDDVTYLSNTMDRRDSAVKFWYPSTTASNEAGSWTFADHNYQGFAKLKDFSSGDSMRITSPDGDIEEYIVTEVLKGKNEDRDLTVNGTSIIGQKSDEIILYTCASYLQSVDVTIVLARPVD